MVWLNWRCLDCGNLAIIGERPVREIDGGNTMQGLFSSDLRFLWGYVDAEDSIYVCMYVFMYVCMYISAGRNIFDIHDGETF